jgi:H+/Cl- antiporter ClcA
MSAGRVSFSNQTVYIIIAVVVVVVAFFLLGGGPWVKGLSHGNGSAGLNDLKWIQILISLGIGFLLGYLVSRRR